MVYTEKAPVVYDVAADDVGSLFTSPVPYGVWARASVGYFTDYAHPWKFHSVGRDSGIQKVWEDSRKRGYRFGPYHYTVQGGIAEQAECFTDTLLDLHVSENGKWNAELPPVIDIELECTNGAQVGLAYANMMKQWIDRVEQVLQTPVAIYTARPQWSYILINGSICPEWVAGRLLWCKWYPYDDYIDRNSTFPVTMLPAGWKLEQLIAWQYSDHGRANGNRCNDQNVMTAVGCRLFDSKFPVPETPPITADPTPTITVPLPAQGMLTVIDDQGVAFNGTPIEVKARFFPLTPVPLPTDDNTVPVAPLVTSHKVTLQHNGQADEVQYFVLQADPKKYKIITDTRAVRSYVHSWMLQNRCTYATNGGAGWNSTQIFGQFLSEGRGFGKVCRDTCQLYIDKDGDMSLPRPANVWSTFPFTNLLVFNKALPPIDKAIDYRARTAIGQKQDGTIVLLTVKGGDYYQSHGMSFQEVAQLMQDLGCVLAVMVDGGGSSSMAYVDSQGHVIYLMTNDAAEDTVAVNGVTYKLRATAGHIGICPR